MENSKIIHCITSLHFSYSKNQNKVKNILDSGKNFEEEFIQQQNVFWWKRD